MTKTAASAASRETLNTDLGLPRRSSRLRPLLSFTTRVRKKAPTWCGARWRSHSPPCSLSPPGIGPIGTILFSRPMLVIGNRVFCLRPASFADVVGCSSVSRHVRPRRRDVHLFEIPQADFLAGSADLISPAARHRDRVNAHGWNKSAQDTWTQALARQCDARFSWRSPCTSAHLVRPSQRRAGA